MSKYTKAEANLVGRIYAAGVKILNANEHTAWREFVRRELNVYTARLTEGRVSLAVGMSYYSEWEQRDTLAQVMADLDWLAPEDTEYLLGHQFYVYLPAQLFRPSAQDRYEAGDWVHMVNHREMRTLEDFKKFIEIRGEICVSRFESRKRYYTIGHGSRCGVLFHGTVRNPEPGDVWSITSKGGFRIPTRSPLGEHDEAFLTPSSSEPLAILVGHDAPRDIKRALTEIADHLDLPVVVFQPWGDRECPEVEVAEDFLGVRGMKEEWI